MTLLDRLFGRSRPAAKATYGGPALVAYQNGVPLSVAGVDWQARAAAYLAAYRVGWFYKAGSRISRDLANLEWTLAYEDSEGDNAEEITAAPSGTPFESLDPLEQLLRLAERPNPYQTGRTFKQQQQIRLDFTGRALVYLEGGQGGGLPSALYGISPDRMWPARDTAGNLIGWVMDKHAPSGGVPFETDEIVVIEYPSGDTDPIGVVESVYAHVPLTRQVPQHVSDILATGGRLAGMAWPKNRSLGEDEFTDAQRAWRNVTSDPNAARRLLLFPEPMEYATGAASPTEIGIPELALLNRDEILTAFPIHPFMVGVPVAAGLNSGESLRFVRGEYWEGTLHPRVEIWEDAFQQQLLPRYEAAVGRPLDFDIEEPDLDDAEALTAKADALKALIALGFDEKEAVAAVGLDHIAFNGTPAPEPVPVPPPDDPTAMPDMMSRTAQQGPAPAKAYALKARRDRVIGETLPGFVPVMREALREQRDRVAAAVAEAYKGTTKAERAKAAPVWWDQPREDAWLKDAMRALYVRLSREAMQNVATDVDRLIYGARIERIADAVLAKAGERITAINETTRQKVADLISEGVRRGLSIAQIVNGAPAEGFPGITGATAFDDARAELIARTESMLAYNQANLSGYREFGIETFEVYDGDQDEECAARDGRTVDGDTMQEWVDAEHPNGTLDFAPVWSDKAWRDRVPSPPAVKIEQGGHQFHIEPHIHLAANPTTVPVEVKAPQITVLPADVTVPAPVVNVSLPEQPAPVVTVIPPDPAVVNVAAPEVKVYVPEQPAPVVTVEPPVVHVAAPSVEVKAPDVTVAAPDVTVNVDAVRVTQLPERVHQVVRDADGKPIGSVETDA